MGTDKSGGKISNPRAIGVGPASLARAGPVWELIKHAKAVYCCD